MGEVELLNNSLTVLNLFAENHDDDDENSLNFR
jgi:hypothetical protein